MFIQTLRKAAIASIITLIYITPSSADFSEFTTDQATVAIHLSENTKRNWQKLSSQPDYFGLAHSNSRGWKYWHIHGFLMEQLRSDGTPFKVVSDSEIRNGLLRDEMGLPRYATLFSLNNPCISDETSTEIDAFVIAGGGVISGGASWTRDQECEPRDTQITSSASESHFSNSYRVVNTLDADENTQWINSINDSLPTWLEYRLDGTHGGYPNISKVELTHSRYGDNSAFRYLINQYEVQVSNSPTCASSTFSTVTTNSGNNLIGEVQETSFSPVPARCVRINILSSHESLAYANYDTSQWVGLAEFKVFNSEGLEVNQRTSISATATSENRFSSSYLASNSIDDNPNNLWINQIDSSLPVSIDYRLTGSQNDVVNVSSIALQHSNYEERQTGFKYLIKDYDLLYSTDSNCSNLILIDSLRGNDLSREIQKTKLETPLGVRCIRVRINSSYESLPYLDEDTTQWVAIAGFQVFDQSGNALIDSSDISNDPWKPMGLRP
ncbi:MAG: discoidin domain-containing protein, partial [Acidiferrobacterales bacterium]|nr:discoidin domain-containing protein [Acidiferrobacterales bacterium]